ncbi:hypothetical protein ASZ90_010996 [hydrocarbon metagenome]|uniref:Uncharacterized protein n=1 Tax=hydrocarbon metagenome TaxID=938273 RepID=A0A0W8FEG5_9ZZZZ
MIEINRDAYQALQKLHPIEGMIIEKMVADGRAVLTDGPTRTE